MNNYPSTRHESLKTRCARAALLIAIFAASVSAVGAADLVFSVIPPAERLTPGQSAHVKLLAVNPAAIELPFDPGRVLGGQVSTDSGKRDIQFEGDGLGMVNVRPGGFGARDYRFTVPPDVGDHAILSITLDRTHSLQTVIEITSSSATGAAHLSKPASSLKEATMATDTLINRTFVGRLSPNEPTYFIAGRGDKSAAKFQFSFNYRLGSFDWRDGSVSRIQLGYTERSLWDVKAGSSPFYDTSYMPELSIDLARRFPERADQWFTWLGAAAGVKHESNGRDGLDSRSMNTTYLHAGFAIGRLDSWHLILAPEVFTYFGGLGENEEIKDFRGYGRLRAVFGRKDGPSLLAAVWAGRDLDHVTYQLDLSHPIRTRFLKIETFLLLQYFNGYGESFKDYDKRTNALRFGVEIVR